MSSHAAELGMNDLTKIVHSYLTEQNKIRKQNSTIKKLKGVVTHLEDANQVLEILRMEAQTTANLLYNWLKETRLAYNELVMQYASLWLEREIGNAE